MNLLPSQCQGTTTQGHPTTIVFFSWIRNSSKGVSIWRDTLLRFPWLPTKWICSSFLFCFLLSQFDFLSKDKWERVGKVHKLSSLMLPSSSPNR